MRRFVPVVAVLSMLAVGCGDDDDQADGDVERYCQLVHDLDEAGDEAFAALEEDDSATDEDYAQAEADFLEAHEDDFAEIRQAAPEEISDAIETVLDAQADRAAGGEQEGATDEVEAAEEKLGAFEDANCT